MNSSVQDALKQIASKYNINIVPAGSTAALIEDLMLVIPADKTGDLIIQHSKPRAAHPEFPIRDFALEWRNNIDPARCLELDSLPDSFSLEGTNQLTAAQMTELQRKNKQRKLKNKRRKARKK